MEKKNQGELTREEEQLFSRLQREQEPDGRGAKIIRVSVIGILANVGLALFKAVIGILSHSIAIVLDAVNNISDAASSLITIIGTKLAGKEPDKAHPFGYGRIEYLSAMVISVIVLYAGLTSFTESVKAILHPATPSYSTVSLVIVAVGVLVKIVLGRFVKSQGQKLNSDSLINSGQDAVMDSVISASTLVAAILYVTIGLSLEAWLGAVISVFIIKSGLEMLKETLSRILGERADAALAREIKKTVLSFPEVSGVYDLVLNNYGPDTFNGSLHVAVPDTMEADQIDTLTRKIVYRVLTEQKVFLTAVGIYSVNTKDEEAAAIRDEVVRLARSEEYVTQVHGFYLSRERKTIRFDVIISFSAPDRRAVYRAVCEKVQARYPDYQLLIAMDRDFSEE